MSEDEKVKWVPFRFLRMKKGNIKKRIVPCEVSERWIQLPKYSDKTSKANYLTLQIMTSGRASNKEKELCELIVDREKLEYLLSTINTIDHCGTENDE